MRATAAAACASHPLIAIAWDGVVAVVFAQQDGTPTYPPVCCQLDAPVRWLRWAPRPAPALLVASELGELALCECVRGAAAGRGHPALRHSTTFSGDPLVALEWLGGGSSSGVDGVLPHGLEGFVTVGACAAVTVRWRLCFLAEPAEPAAWTVVRARLPLLDAVDCAAVGSFQPCTFLLAASARSLGGSVLLFRCSLLDENGFVCILSILPLSQLPPPPSPSRVLWLGIGARAEVLLARREVTRTTMQLWRPRSGTLRETKCSGTSRATECSDTLGTTGCSDTLDATECGGTLRSSIGHLNPIGLEPGSGGWECAGQVAAPTELGAVRSVACSQPVSACPPTASVSSVSSISQGSGSSISPISPISQGSSAAPAPPISTVLLQHECGAFSAFDAGDWTEMPRPTVTISAAEVAAAASAAWPYVDAGFGVVQNEHGSSHPAPSLLPTASGVAAAAACHGESTAALHASKRARVGRCHLPLAVLSPHGTLALLVGPSDCRMTSDSGGGGGGGASGRTFLRHLPLHLSLLPVTSSSPVPAEPDGVSAQLAPLRRSVAHTEIAPPKATPHNPGIASPKIAPPGIPGELPPEMPNGQCPTDLDLPSEAMQHRHAVWLSEHLTRALDPRSPQCSVWDLFGGGLPLRPSVSTHAAATVRRILAPLLPLQLSAAPPLGVRAVSESKWRQSGPRCYALLAALSHSTRDTHSADGYRILLALTVSGCCLIDRLRLATPPAEAAFLSAIDDAAIPGGAPTDPPHALSPAGVTQREGAKGAASPAQAAGETQAHAAKAHPPPAPDYSALLPECEWLLLLTWLWLRGRAEAASCGGEGRCGTGTDLSSLGAARQPTSMPEGAVPPTDTPASTLDPDSQSAEAIVLPWRALPPPVRTVLPLATAIALKGARAAEGERRPGIPRGGAVAQLPVGTLVALHRAAASLLSSQAATQGRVEALPEASADSAWRLDGAGRRLGLSDPAARDKAAGELTGARVVAPPLPRLAAAVVAGPLCAYHAVAQWAGIGSYYN